MSAPGGGANRDAAIARLWEEIARLRLQMRASSDFRGFKPGLFYYLFSLLVSVLAPLLTGLPFPGAGTLAVAVLCFGLLCWAPVWVNRLRYWLEIRRPNRRLESRIAALRAQIGRLRASSSGSSPNAACEPAP